MSEIIPIASPIVSSISAAIAYSVYRFNSKSILRPVLVFYRKFDNGSWWIENVGKGPAVRVDIVHTPIKFSDKTRQDQTVLCTPIPSGKAYNLPWVGCPESIFVNYKDVDDREYSTECSNYENKTKDKFLAPQDEDNVIFEFQARELHRRATVEGLGCNFNEV